MPSPNRASFPAYHLWNNVDLLVNCFYRREVFLIFCGTIIRAVTFALLLSSLSMILFLMYTAYTVTGGVLTNEIVFTPLSLLIQLRISSVYFLRCIMCLAEGIVAITRIQVCGSWTVC